MSLSEPLQELLRRFEPWSTPDLIQRMERIQSGSLDELSRLVEDVLPCLSLVDAHLGALGKNAYDEDARRLLLLVESALDARQELDARSIPADDPVTAALVDSAIETVEFPISDQSARAADRFMEESEDGH